MNTHIQSQTPKIPLKSYLRRKPFLSHSCPKLLQKINLKGLHLRELQQTTSSEKNDLLKTKWINRKLLKTLTHITLTNTGRYFWLRSIKNCQRLKEVTANSIRPFSYMRNHPRYLRSLPKSVQKVDLGLEDHSRGWMKEKVYEIIKAIMRLRGLVKFISYLNIRAYPSTIAKQFKIMDRFLKRHPKRENFKYTPQLYGELRNFSQKKKNPGTKWVTGPFLTIDEQIPKDFYAGFDPYLVPENSDDGYSDDETDSEDSQTSSSASESSENPSHSSSNNSSVDNSSEESSDFTSGDDSISDHDQIGTPSEIKGDIINKIMPAFRVGLFPRLQKLYLTTINLYHFGDYMIKNFAELQQLKVLRIDLDRRPQGSVYLFKALLELPNLADFEFTVPFIQQREWKILDTFLAKQKDLEKLSLTISRRRKHHKSYQVEGHGIQKIMHTVNELEKSCRGMNI